MPFLKKNLDTFCFGALRKTILMHVYDYICKYVLIVFVLNTYLHLMLTFILRLFVKYILFCPLSIKYFKFSMKQFLPFIFQKSSCNEVFKNNESIEPTRVLLFL